MNAPLYDREPNTQNWQDIVIKCSRPSGWKVRVTLEQTTDEARMNFSSAMSHIEERDWLNALVCIEDGITEAEKLKTEPLKQL